MMTLIPAGEGRITLDDLTSDGSLGSGRRRVAWSPGIRLRSLARPVPRMGTFLGTYGLWVKQDRQISWARGRGLIPFTSKSHCEPPVKEEA